LRAKEQPTDVAKNYLLTNEATEMIVCWRCALIQEKPPLGRPKAQFDDVTSDDSSNASDDERRNQV